MKGIRARAWAKSFVNVALHRYDERDYPAWAAISALAEMDRDTFRRTLHARRDGENIVFLTSGERMGTAGGTMSFRAIRGRSSELVVKHRVVIDVLTFQLQAPVDDEFARFMAGYLDGEIALSIPHRDRFDSRDPLHVLVASRIVHDMDLARACEFIWEMEGWTHDEGR